MQRHSQIQRKTFIGATIAAAAALVPRLLARQSSPTGLQQALSSEGLTIQRANELLAVCVPIGGIVPYVGDVNLPSNWQICDGGDLRPDANAALKVRLGGKVPSMVGRVPRGVTISDQVAVSIGSDRLEFPVSTTDHSGGHRHRVDAHTHPLSGRTGLVSSEPADSVQPMAFKNEDGRWLTESHINRIDSGQADDEGQHRHDLGGHTDDNANTYTDSVDSHAHTIPEHSAECIPASTTVVYIIRIY